MRRLILALLVAGGCWAQTPAIMAGGGGSGGGSSAPCTTTDLIFLNTAASTPGCTSLLSFNVAGKYLNINSIRVWRGLGDVSTNTAVGDGSLGNTTSGGSNSAFGNTSCGAVTSGSFNTCGGVSAGAAITTNSHMTAFGRQAGVLATGSGGTFVGSNAGLNTTTGSQNTMVGYNTGLGITTGEKNTVIGANVTGLTSSLSNNIILADGDGNVRAQSDSAGLWTHTGTRFLDAASTLLAVRAGPSQTANTLFSLETNAGTRLFTAQATAATARVYNSGTYGWSSTSASDSGSYDTCFGRVSAGLVEITNCTVNTWRAMMQSATYYGGSGATTSAYIANYGNALITRTGAGGSPTVASLSTCNSTGRGSWTFVTDALAPAIGSTVAAGGSAYAMVTCNGANWTVIGI